METKHKGFRQTLNGKMKRQRPYQWWEKALVLRLRVQPRARKTTWNGILQGMIRLRLNAVPADNKANHECIRFLAENLKTPPSSIRLVLDHKGFFKTVEIESPDQACWQNLLTTEFAPNPSN